MIRFFRFFSIAYPVIFFGALILASALEITIKEPYSMGVGYIIASLCGIFLGLDYSDRF